MPIFAYVYMYVCMYVIGRCLWLLLMHFGYCIMIVKEGKCKCTIKMLVEEEDMFVLFSKFS